jgi:hypothetical protein
MPLRRSWPIAIAAVLMLFFPSAADARPVTGTGLLLPPATRIDGVTGADATGEGWYLALSQPASGAHDSCVPYGNNGRILLALGDQPQQCTVERGTTILVIGLTTFCDSVYPPAPRTRTAQMRCAWEELDRVTASVRLTVDGGTPVELRRSRFAACSAQRRVVLPPDNILGVDPQPATFTACGWVAWLVDLPVGRHTATTTATGADGEIIHTWSPTIEVLPRRR